MYAAALYACDDIEAAVVSKTLHDWGWEIHLRTVEDWPGTLLIRRSDDQPRPTTGRVYQASAAIGRFEDDHADRAQALLEAFDQHLQAFGRKKRLPE